MENNLTIRGGEFLIKETQAQNIFIPEEFGEEQQIIAKTCTDFIEREILPLTKRIENQEDGLMKQMLKKSADLGLLAISIPEEYEGFGQNFLTSMLVTEKTGHAHSFTVAFTAHVGIGTTPILYYGNNEQKTKYLPHLASGQFIGAYCLTEANAGTDANSCKTKATLSNDGKYFIINGQKTWITNAGIADIFIVFAKIENDKNLSTFIVERNIQGVNIQAEEQKLGIKGSSTCQIFFDNCKIPVENLLGERNEGFKIALNILNLGRIKLAAAVVGGMKRVINLTVEYANQRRQFNKAISEFGAIQHKIAEQAIRLFALESATYRCSNDIEQKIEELKNKGFSSENANIEGIKEFACEAALLKVYASEAADFAIDEGLQIFGGMGYSAEAPMEMLYRDARIYRIFEGTNEINRMLIVDLLLKKTFKGELNLLKAAKSVADELLSIPSFDEKSENAFSNERKAIENFKKTVLLVAGAAVRKLMLQLENEQEILMNIADMIIDTYIAESLLLRVEKLCLLKSEANNKQQINILRVFIYDAADRISKTAKDAVNSFAESDEQQAMLLGIKRFTKQIPTNTKNLRREIAKTIIVENRYSL